MFFRINFLSQISSFGHRNIFHLQSFSFALELFFQRKSLACREVNFYQKQSFVSKKRISFCLWKKSWTILNHSAGGGVRATVGRRRHSSREQLSFHCTTRQCHPQVLILSLQSFVKTFLFLKLFSFISAGLLQSCSTTFRISTALRRFLLLTRFTFLFFSPPSLLLLWLRLPVFLPFPLSLKRHLLLLLSLFGLSPQVTFTSL